ncbi:hypothetical protein ACE6H2_004789 [Prunus campanulata]
MSTSSLVTQDQIHRFHKTDREIFSRLVINFMRDPAESLLVMALWLWLQDKGFNLMANMLTLPDTIVNALADEAVICLKCLDAKTSLNTMSRLAPNGLLFTSRLMEREIPLDMFSQSRYTIISGRVLYPNPQGFLDPNQPLAVPGFPHPVFGSVTIINPMFSSDHGIPTGGLWGWHPYIELSVDDRTMFLTFSRGFPVSEEEVKELFIDLLGFYNCVESVQMEHVVPNEQPLYAKMVLISVIFVDKILKGNRVSKFRINGKHIWARKYERRE